MRELDARGLVCPQPVLLTRKALEEGAGELAVLVDNEDSAQNVQRFAEGKGCRVTVARQGKEYRLEMRTTGDTPAAQNDEISCAAGSYTLRRGKVILISSDTFGRPSEELGRVLILALLNTLAESPTLPEKILLSNGGVRLACLDEDAIAALRAIEARGVSIMACGTCLGYFQLKERLAVGRATNALEILNAMLAGDVVSWS